MKFSSALTMTTVLSIISATHGAPVLSTKDAPNAEPVHGHYRRASSVSELAGRDYSANYDILQNLNVAFEPGNGIKNLLSFVKRQLGGSAGGSSMATSTTTTSSDGSGNTPTTDVEETGQRTDATSGNAAEGLMGGNMGSSEAPGFAFEPGNGLMTS